MAGSSTTVNNGPDDGQYNGQQNRHCNGPNDEQNNQQNGRMHKDRTAGLVMTGHPTDIICIPVDFMYQAHSQ